MYNKTFRHTLARMCGVTLIELIVAIVVIAAGVAGVTMTYNIVVKNSADPAINKQALALAESLLTEIEQQSFTYCDFADAQFQEATSGTDCTAGFNQDGAALGPVPVGDNRQAFNNVSDYNGYAEGNLGDMTGSNRIANYSARVNVTRVGTSFLSGDASAQDGDALRISVTVTGPGNHTVTLVGYRTRYAPNSP